MVKWKCFPVQIISLIYLTASWLWRFCLVWWGLYKISLTQPCFPHSLLAAANQHLPSPPFYAHSHCLNVSKISWFPSLSSWRMKNFLGKHFTFLATWELLSKQPKPGLSALPSTPFYIRLLTNNLLSGRREGQKWSCGLSTMLKSFAELAQSFTVNRHECSCWIPHKGKKGLFHPAWTSEWEKAAFLCGWILGSQLVKRTNFPSQQVRQGNCPLTQGGSCQNKHVGDNVSQLVFSLLFLLYLFPTSPIQAFPELYVPAATHRLCTKHWCGWMRAHDSPLENRSIVIMAVGDPVLRSSRVQSCKQIQVGLGLEYVTKHKSELFTQIFQT